MPLCGLARVSAVTGAVALALLTAGCLCWDVIDDPYAGTHLIKVDADGHLSWKKFLPDSYLSPLATMDDGGLLVGGYGPGSWIARLDDKGELRWDRLNNDTVQWPVAALAQANDGSFIAYDRNGSMAAIDNDGSILWHRNGSNYSQLADVMWVAVTENGFVVAGPRAVAWLDSGGNVTHKVTLKYPINSRPSLRVIEGGDCIIVYCAIINKTKGMCVARLGDSGYVWDRTIANDAAAFLYEVPGEGLHLAYGDARVIDPDSKVFNRAFSNELTLKVERLDYGGAVGQARDIDAELPCAIAGDGGFVYADFDMYTNAEKYVWPGPYDVNSDVRVTRLDAVGAERWNATVEMGEIWYPDDPEVVTKVVESVTPTSDGGYIVMVHVRRET